ncbi:hypothetical protein FACS1894140_3860 [Spirochaetia bacterium]|nr:hypothetical protein FACS1894140_3860 [Spirochaetia bacterium]
MGEFIHKPHNVSVLIYHIVCPTKYRRVVINSDVEKTIKETCEGIENRYEIEFLEIGMEGDHVHFLIQSVPKYSPRELNIRSPEQPGRGFKSIPPQSGGPILKFV